MRSMFIAISLLVANILNFVAPQIVGLLSDWFAGGHATDAARCAWPADAGAHRILGGLSSVPRVEDDHRGSEARDRLHENLGALDLSFERYEPWQNPRSIGDGCP
jgi:hypothetical protein